MANQIYCKHCGKLIDADSAFCMHCGGAIQDYQREVSFIRIVDKQAGKFLVVIIHYTKRLINLLNFYWSVFGNESQRIRLLFQIMLPWLNQGLTNAVEI